MDSKFTFFRISIVYETKIPNHTLFMQWKKMWNYSNKNIQKYFLKIMYLLCVFCVKSSCPIAHCTRMKHFSSCTKCILLNTNNFRDTYSNWSDEAIVVNALAMVLVALVILVSFAVRSPSLRGDAKVYVTERL